ncbi:DUF1266 domain-containing protein [Cellulophaga sp. HaHaR_3_176]|uniref:DUF1266 domain-containing protein n=1 Tax=Cellulophaga sp. HaHaR_3_176 TaxID=1942464 RepID=UPI001C1F7D01|nr:DUF1266 domain-containing protein [Cellulophaga sp. HaHaR_3_176]QWX84251.1 DUF1266 domain-containing protein [Cellulophaga sp. HaHaR_3_176]
MKSKLLSISFLLLLVIATSCGSKEEKKELKDDKLSGFMVGGIYFVHGYGGQSEVNSMLVDYKTDEELISAYKELFEFPFDDSQKSGTKRMLKSMWDISDKASLLKSIEDLQTKTYEYKAWDYARVVNNACMGYAAGYLSKDEVVAINSKTLALAKENYTDWEKYYTDFDLGRNDWDSEDSESEAFEKLSKNITKGEKSIYLVLPLN